MIHTSS